MDKIIQQDINDKYGKYYFLKVLSLLTFRKSAKLEALKQQVKQELEEEKEYTRL
ncbi:hypothetical protein [Sediminibacillus halophilus]|uniref:Uncharacterized protein n=1 Tax=Sediminibacillus halophilus TaxID=482461 RepID=A0A1G9NL32_9BACI|nr:hypothetical protein [Sediminibacillus halophilus]SDL86695.1 hypothetical protein SAMN05216244_1033 [Sediminibacillus halophilus]